MGEISVSVNALRYKHCVVIADRTVRALCDMLVYKNDMAIANGTCVSFCNQPEAHFGLPWVRPLDNRGKCHMDEKRIQCL